MRARARARACVCVCVCACVCVRVCLSVSVHADVRSDEMSALRLFSVLLPTVIPFFPSVGTFRSCVCDARAPVDAQALRAVRNGVD